MARLGYVQLAFTGALSTPLMTCLLGAGGSSLVLMFDQRPGITQPGSSVWFRHMDIKFDRTLMVSGIGLLVTLTGMLVVVPARKWHMDRVVGGGLIAVWAVTTVVNLLYELMRTGVVR